MPRELHLQRLRLYDAQGREDDKVLSARHVAGQFQLRVRSAQGNWLQFDVREGQAGLQLEPAHALGDYLLRIYGLRTLLIVLLALLVVRWLTRPLTRLGAAAQALGRNLHAPPLPLEGPREVRQAAQAFNQMQQQLQQAAQGNDIERLQALSHSLKSSSANVGALSLSAVARRIEHEARAGSLQRPAVAVALLVAEFARARVALTGYLAQER